MRGVSPLNPFAMAHETDHSHNVRKVVLPSGKTIEVVYFDEQLEAPAPNAPQREEHLRDGDLHVCGGCDSHLVQPLDWSEAGVRHWEITLRCPECEWVGTGIFEQDAVERYDLELDRGTETLLADLETVTTANMNAEIRLFTEALQAGLIMPEDF